MKASSWLLPVAFLTSCGVAASAEQALKDSTVKFNFRYRLEQANPDNSQETALASTLRSRISIQTGKWQFTENQSLKALVEYDNVTNLGGETYNSTVNGNSSYATIADPNGTDLNQVALQYAYTKGGQVTIGRQRLNLLNQRFIGSVGWRQNEQTFDGLRVEQQLGDNWQIDVASLHNANRVFGPEGSAADLHGRFNVAHLNWAIAPKHSASAFYYDTDYDTLLSRSSNTTGVDYQGEQNAWKWQLSAARQQDAHAATNNYQLNYHRLETSYKLQKLTVKVWQERLASDGTNAFQTPFATLHAFQGFADMFLTTPTQGIRENALQVGYPVMGVKSTLSYHQFDADVGSAKLGSEIDATASYDISENLQMMAKLAFYQADTYQVDTNKVWLMFSYQL